MFTPNDVFMPDENEFFLSPHLPELLLVIFIFFKRSLLSMEQVAVSLSSHLSVRGFVSMPAWACHLLLCRLLFISIFPLLAHLSATLTFFQPHLSKLPYSLSRFFLFLPPSPLFFAPPFLNNVKAI